MAPLPYARAGLPWLRPDAISAYSLRFNSARWAILIFGGLWSPLGLAHGSVDIGGFYQGMATVALHWEMSLLLVASGLWCAQQDDRTQLAVGATLVISLVGGFLWGISGRAIPMPVFAASLAYCLIGVAVAVQLRRWMLCALPLAASAGILSGAALGTNELGSIDKPWLFGLGLGVAASLSIFYIAAAVIRLPAGWPWIGVRILGSWIAAIGLMVSAFTLS